MTVGETITQITAILKQLEIDQNQAVEEIRLERHDLTNWADLVDGKKNIMKQIRISLYGEPSEGWDR